MLSAIRSITAKAAWLRYDLGNAQKQLIIAWTSCRTQHHLQQGTIAQFSISTSHLKVWFFLLETAGHTREFLNTSVMLPKWIHLELKDQSSILLITGREIVASLGDQLNSILNSRTSTVKSITELAYSSLYLETNHLLTSC